MLTKDDIGKLIDVFATKEDLNHLKEEYVTKTEFDERIDGVVDKLDAVYGELKDFRQEQTVHASQHEQISADINNLKQEVAN